MGSSKTGRRDAKRQFERPRGSPERRAQTKRVARSPLAVGTAALFVATCALPIVLWGNPYPDELLRYWLVGGGAALVVAAVAVAVPGDVMGRLARWLERPSPAVFALGVALVAFMLSLAFAVFVFRRGASTSDELATLWHARILLTGRFSLPVDPNREFFSLENVVDTGRWYSQFPIGGPAFVALGAMAGAPWLVNPILAGASAALLYQAGRRMFGETRGRATAALFSVTPMVFMLAGTWMNHVPALFLALVALVALVEWTNAESPRRRLVFAALIGFAVAGVATIRPLDAIVLAVVFGTFQLTVLRAAPSRWLELIAQVAGGALGIAPLLIANHATTGHALTFGYDVTWGAGHRVGFHTDPYGVPHTPQRALEYIVTYVSELNVNLLAWPIPALLVAVVGLWSARRATRWDALMIAFLWTQVAAYAAYWGDGEFLGPRFLFTALPAAIALIAWMPFATAERYGGAGRRAGAAIVVACVAIAWILPVGSFGVWGLATQARGVRTVLKADVAGAVKSANAHNALVFIREPFGARLSRRLWGLGVMRSDAAQLLASRDACSLFDAVRAAEADNRSSPADKLESIKRDAAAFTPGEAVRVSDPMIHISSPRSITPACQAELESDRGQVVAAFGPALPLEPIGPDGRLDGDVIYAADLGERNELLRARFGNRTWYRLVRVPNEGGGLGARLRPY